MGLKSVEFYDDASNTWSKGPDLPVATLNNMLVTVNGRVYALGGKTGTTPHRAIYVLKADFSAWERFDQDLTADAAFGFTALVYNVGYWRVEWWEKRTRDFCMIESKSK